VINEARRGALRALRFAVSVALLTAVAIVVDIATVLRRLGELRPGWVLLALAISIPQMILLAWRWRFTAGRLGVELSMREAVGEYYLGTFLNQVVPGGITGDVSRAVRHARSVESGRPAVVAVALERLSAQVAMTLVAVLSVIGLPVAPGWLRWSTALVLAVGATLYVGYALAPPRREGRGRWWRSSLHRTLFEPTAFAVQSVTSAVVVASYIGVYIVAARAVGVHTPLAALAPLIAPVLMTMLIPVTVAGWGVRETAAAALWELVGLAPADGVAISVAYGLLVLASTAPGALVMAGLADGGPGRRGRRRPDENDETEA
jgi:uncharacterized membrane protein YbhN (UPF0104 family)